MKQIKLDAIITCPYDAQQLNTLLNNHPELSLCNLYDINRTRGVDTAKRLGAALAASPDTVLQSENTAVFVHENYATAGETILLAAKAGKHIASPNLALSSADITRAIHETLQRNRLSYLPYNIHRPQTLLAKQYAEDARLGRITNLRVHCTGYDPANSSHAADSFQLLAQACSIMHLFFGMPKHCKTLNSSVNHEQSVVLFEFPDQQLGIAEISPVSPSFSYSMDLLGTHGWFLIRDDQVSYTNADPMNRDNTWTDILPHQLQPAKNTDANAWIQAVMHNEELSLNHYSVVEDITRMCIDALDSTGDIKPVQSAFRQDNENHG